MKSSRVNRTRSTGWFSALELSSPLLNALAMMTFSSLLIGIVLGAALFGTKVPDGDFLSFQSFLQHILSPFSTWQFALSQMALLHPIIDQFSGDWFGLSLTAYLIFMILLVLGVGLMYRAFQKGWNAKGYNLRLSLIKFGFGILGCIFLPVVVAYILYWIANPFSSFTLGSPWLKTMFMGVAAWVFYAAIFLWTSPNGHRAFSVFAGATVATLAFVISEPTAQWIIDIYGPFSFLTEALAFLVWNFCLWLNLFIGFFVVLKNIEPPESLFSEVLGDRLNLSLRVLKAISKRVIRGGRAGHTVESLSKHLDISAKTTLTTLAFLQAKGYVRNVHKKLLDFQPEWQLVQPLKTASMSQLLADLDGSLIIRNKGASEKISEFRGLDGLEKLESYWSNASIADFLGWEWQQKKDGDNQGFQPNSESADATLCEVPGNCNTAADGTILWFESELYHKASAVAEIPMSSEIDTTLQDVQRAIAETKVASSKQQNYQPSISDIIRNLATN